MKDPDRRIPQASYDTPAGADETVPRAASADVIGPANAVVQGVPTPSQDATAAPPRRGLLRRRRISRPRMARLSVTGRVHTLDSLSYRDFRLLWMLTLCEGGATWLIDLVLGWLTYELTQSPLLTALALSLGALPFLVAAPVAGLIADTFDRRKLLVGALGYLAVLTAGFSAIVLSGGVQTWHIFTYVLLIGVAWIVMHSAIMPMVTAVVPRKNLVNAFALYALAFNVMRLVVPALTGVSIAVIGPGGTLLVAVVLLGAGSAAGLAVHIEDQEGPQPRRRPSMGQMFEGFRYAAGDPVVLPLLLLGVIPVVLLVPVINGLMPVYASEIFEVGPAGLGLLVSAMGFGATAGAIGVASLGTVRNKGRLVYVALGVGIVSMAAFSVSTAMPLSIVILAVLAGSVTTFGSVSLAMIQEAAPDNLRGRVAALSGMPIGLFPIGGLLAGGVAELLGAPAATLAAAVVMVLLVGVFALKFRQVWSLQ